MYRPQAGKLRETSASKSMHVPCDTTGIRLSLYGRPLKQLPHSLAAAAASCRLSSGRRRRGCCAQVGRWSFAPGPGQRSQNGRLSSKVWRQLMHAIAMHGVPHSPGGRELPHRSRKYEAPVVFQKSSQFKPDVIQTHWYTAVYQV